MFFSFFFFNDTATTEIYTLSLHDALPISSTTPSRWIPWRRTSRTCGRRSWSRCHGDRKSTRLNSSHGYISYAVFCLKKKKKKIQQVYSMQIMAHDIEMILTHIVKCVMINV